MGWYISVTCPVASPIWLPYELYPWAAPKTIVLCGSFPFKVSSTSIVGSAAPVTLMAWYTYVLPDNGSLIAPPRQVAAPPKGSISVGWLWVSFLNITRYSSLPLSVSMFTFIEQAFISSDTSKSSNKPFLRISFITITAISIRFSSLVVSLP